MFAVLRRLCLIALVALWLPATSHCSIEAASEWVAEICGVSCDHADTSAHTHASCAEVESGNYTLAATIVHAPAPNLGALACLACIHARLLEEARPLSPPTWAKDHPQDWIPAWTFTHRAALPARAPDLS